MSKRTYSKALPCPAFTPHLARCGRPAVFRWAFGWKKRGWKRPGGVPVRNFDIVEGPLGLYLTLAPKITLNHVKAHAGIEGNELADRMAMRAATERMADFWRYEGKLDVDEVLAFTRG